MSPGEIERRTTSGPIAQSAERKTRTRKLRGKQRANKTAGVWRGEGRGRVELAGEKTGIPATFPTSRRDSENITGEFRDWRGSEMTFEFWEH